MIFKYTYLSIPLSLSILYIYSFFLTIEFANTKLNLIIHDTKIHDQ